MTDISTLKEWARRIRLESLKMIHTGPAGHPGGTLSVTEIVTALYFSEINVKPEQPDWPERDRVVLSKGHACAALYSALGLRGFFPIKEFEKFKRIDGLLEGHPTIDIPGVDAVSGSLGMGLSQGLGMALGARHSQKNYRAYVILGDGDLQEGATWEALMAAGHHKLNNLCAILDYNKLQQEGQVDSMMNFAPLDEKVAAFHWSVIEVDGFDFNQLQNAFSKARAEEKRPTFIIAHTTKGKGVSFMENQVGWHGSVPLGDDDFANAIEQIEQM